MRTKTAFIMCCVPGISAAGHVLTFDVREGYRAGSHSYESRYKVSQGRETGWWVSMEMDNKNNKNNHQGNQGTSRADGSHPPGNSTVDYNEIGANYSWPFIDKWALQPGGIYHWSSRGTQLWPYSCVNYKVMSDLTFGLCYRYGYNTYETVSSAGEPHRDSINRLDLYAAYKFNARWSALYQDMVYRHVNDDYKYKNDKSSATENVLALYYKWNNWFSPYIEYDYLGKQGYHDDQNKTSESRYRIGMTSTL